MGISLVTALFLTSYSCTCRLVRSESGPGLNGTTTSPQGNICQQGSTGLSPITGAAISLFVMLLMILLCSSILFMVVIKQREDGNKVQKWLRSIKATQQHLEPHSHDCNNGSMCTESDTSTNAYAITTVEGDYDIVTAECGTNNLADLNDNLEDSNEACNSEIYETIS